MSKETIPLTIMPLQMLPLTEIDALGINAYKYDKDRFFEPWGEDEFWNDFCFAFPNLTETVIERKNSLSIGFSENDSNFEYGKMVKQITSEDKIFAGLFFSNEYDKLPENMKKKIAFHEMLHFMRLSGCKIINDDLTQVYYSKTGHSVEKFDANFQLTDGFGNGLEEACVENAALSGVNVSDVEYENTYSDHSYSSLIYCYKKLENSGFSPLLDEIVNTPIEEGIDFYERIFDCLYNEPTNDFDFDFNNLADAFDDQYIQTVFGSLRGMSVDEMILEEKPSFINLVSSVDSFCNNVDKNESSSISNNANKSR